MELHEFITVTLVDIQRGVHDAIAKAKSENLTGVINPVWGAAEQAGKDDIQKVGFDIAVTVSDRSTGEAGGGIKVLNIGVGAKMATTDENSQVSRIQFAIPLIPPMTIVAKTWE